jgi:hypothetical protein
MHGHAASGSDDVGPPVLYIDRAALENGTFLSGPGGPWFLPVAPWFRTSALTVTGLQPTVHAVARFHQLVAACRPPINSYCSLLTSKLERDDHLLQLCIHCDPNPVTQNLIESGFHRSIN